MKHSTGTFCIPGSLDLFYQSWHPDSQSKAVFIIIHGFGEHSGRYPHLVQHLTQHEIAVYTFDQRGFGRSPGQRGHINHWDEYRQDVRTFIQMVKKQENNLPVFLFGHSMGAITVLDDPIFFNKNLAGIIAQGGPFEPVGVGSPVLIKIARFMSKIMPSFSLSLYINPDALSHDPAVAQSYRTDPLVHGKASARWGTETLDAVDRIKDCCTEITVPVLILHGGSDQLNAVHGAYAYFESLSVTDKTIKTYPAAFHELHNEVNREPVFQDLTNWIFQHLA